MVAAVIVTFNPPAGVLGLLDDLADAVDEIVVVDNGSETDEVLDALADRVTLVRLPDNLGLAAALQLGLDRVTAGHDWLLTFDQDSRITTADARLLVEHATGADDSVAVVAPRVVSRETGVVLQGGGVSAIERASRVITSASACRCAAVHAVGGFRADLFIDLVDFDLCARLGRAGWGIEIVNSAVLEHSIGHERRVSLPGFSMRVSDHSPDRLYYRYRNFVRLLVLLFLHDPMWTMRTAVGLAIGPMKVTLGERGRKDKLIAVVDGVTDGLLGRGGSRRQARARGRR